MKKLELMQDPFYAQLMAVIETTICEADDHARAAGVRLTDSSIKYALNRARNITPEQEIAPLPKLESRDEFVEELARNIAANRQLLLEQTPDGASQREVSISDWVKAISAVRASLKIRRSDEPGSRSYLEFIHRFIEDLERSSGVE